MILKTNQKEPMANTRWLADHYNGCRIFDYHLSSHSVECTSSYELDDNLKSPFIGQSAGCSHAVIYISSQSSQCLGCSVQDCAQFIRSAPRASKGLNTRFFAVLRRGLQDNKGMVLVCKARGDKDPQTILSNAENISIFYSGYPRGSSENHKMQVLY